MSRASFKLDSLYPSSCPLLPPALPFAGLCFGIAFALNTIALCYHSLAAVPFGYILAVVLLWSFIAFPLCLVGTVVGRNWNAVPNFPCRVKRIPSPVPERAWYLRPWAISLAGGLLPFGSIFIEMYFIFTSFWGYKVWGRGGGRGGGVLGVRQRGESYKVCGNRGGGYTVWGSGARSDRKGGYLVALPWGLGNNIFVD